MQEIVDVAGKCIVSPANQNYRAALAERTAVLISALQGCKSEAQRLRSYLDRIDSERGVRLSVGSYDYTTLHRAYKEYQEAISALYEKLEETTKAKLFYYAELNELLKMLTIDVEKIEKQDGNVRDEAVRAYKRIQKLQEELASLAEQRDRRDDPGHQRRFEMPMLLAEKNMVIAQNQLRRAREARQALLVRPTRKEMEQKLAAFERRLASAIENAEELEQELLAATNRPVYARLVQEKVNELCVLLVRNIRPL